MARRLPPSALPALDEADVADMLSPELVNGIPIARNLPLHSSLAPPPLLSLTKFREPSMLLPVLSPVAASMKTSQLKDPETIVTTVPDRAVSLAALYVDAALHGRKFDGFAENEFVGGLNEFSAPDTNSRWRLKCYHWLHSKWWRAVYISTCCVHIALAAFEDPSVLNRQSNTTYGIAYGIEWCCVAVYCADLWLSYMVHQSLARLVKQVWRKARCAILCAIITDLLLVLMMGMHYGSYRFSRGFRPFMLIFRLRNLRKVFAACLSTVKRALLIFCLIGFLVITFGCVGFALMNDLVAGTCLATRRAIVCGYWY